jgi:uncharacterized membrane protein HdeD (DUF308 family)
MMICMHRFRQRPVEVMNPDGPIDAEQLRRGSRAIVRAGLVEMSMGVVWVIFPFAGRGMFHVWGGIVIIASGMVLVGYALRARSKGGS